MTGRYLRCDVVGQQLPALRGNVIDPKVSQVLLSVPAAKEIHEARLVIDDHLVASTRAWDAKHAVARVGLDLNAFPLGAIGDFSNTVFIVAEAMGFFQERLDSV